jgi:hypothetical protein
MLDSIVGFTLTFIPYFKKYLDFYSRSGKWASANGSDQTEAKHRLSPRGSSPPPVVAAGSMSRGGVFLGVDVGTGSACAGSSSSDSFEPMSPLFFLAIKYFHRFKI